MFNEWLGAPDILNEYYKNTSLGADSDLNIPVKVPVPVRAKKSTKRLSVSRRLQGLGQVAPKGLWEDMNGNDKNNKMLEASAIYFKSKGLLDFSSLIDQYLTHDRFQCLTNAIHTVERLNAESITYHFLLDFLRLNGRITRNEMKNLVNGSLKPQGKAYKTTDRSSKDTGTVFHDAMQKCGFFRC